MLLNAKKIEIKNVKLNGSLYKIFSKLFKPNITLDNNYGE